MPFSFAADDDDGDFGEFKFVSSSPTPQQQDRDNDDEDWGDFVRSPQTNSIPSHNTKWSKPNGAIPLSIFGDQEEEEEEEADPIRFLNGFSSPSHSKPVARDVRDLISDIYSQPPPPPPASSSSTGSDLTKEKDQFDDDDNSWEFIQAVGNMVENVRKDSDQFRFSIGGSELCSNNIYAAHDRQTNGLNFDSDIAYVKNGNELNPGLENRVAFKDAFLDVAVEFGSLEKQKTPPDAEAQVFMRGNKVQGFASNLGVLFESTHAKEKGELNGSSRTPSGSLTEPNSTQTGIKDSKFHSVIALDDIISDLYNDPGQSHPIKHPSALGPDLAVLSRNSTFANDDTDWQFQKALDPAVANLNSACKIDKTLSYHSTQNTSLDLYYRLKEGSIFLIVHHLDDLKKSQEVAALSGEEAKVSKSSEDIRAVYKVLQEAKISEDDYVGKHSSKGACVNQLVEVIKEPQFQALEEEYRLSERILSAEKELSASIELLGHASTVLHILGLASREEQQAYIAAWSRMALACTKELQHGAMIWNESLRADVCKEILSRGSGYFAALVEIYGVTDILRASLRLYKAWILSNPEDCSRELVSCLEKCDESWTTSGLGKTLENISAATTDNKVKTPVKSIKLLYDLNEFFFRNDALDHDNVVCKLSFLPVDKLQDMKVVMWNGDTYCLKLANFWANRVSCDPPQLPCIHSN